MLALEITKRRLFVHTNTQHERITVVKLTRLIVALMLGIIVAVSGCSKKEEKPKTPPEVGMQSPHAAGVPSVAGIRWTVPKGWVEGPPRQMRHATYMTLPAEGDAEGAECAVFFFGSGQGGDTEMNIERWVSQFENAGTPSRSKREVNGLQVTMLKLTGTYMGMGGGPMMQQQGGSKKENFELLGAIVAGPEGSVFFKLTGPKKTVDGIEGSFNDLIASLQKN
jgi:hypothetical protein